MTFVDEHGNHLISSSIRKTVTFRLSVEPHRFTRPIDAALLDDLISIVSNPRYYKKHFEKAFNYNFQDGHSVLRTILGRLIDPRNRLAHANAISIRQAEQVKCYSNDVIESIKYFYRENNMATDYDVPLIIKYWDFFGNSFTRESWDNQLGTILIKEPEFSIRPGDLFTAEVEVDGSYPSDFYTLTWGCNKRKFNDVSKIQFEVLVKDISESFCISCTLTTKRDWHREGSHDDKLMIFYKVLPPI